MKVGIVRALFFLIGTLSGAGMLWFIALYIYLLFTNEVDDSGIILFELNIWSISFLLSIFLIMVSTIIYAELEEAFEWIGLFKPNNMIQKLCRRSVLFSLLNIIVVFVYAIAMKKYYVYPTSSPFIEKWTQIIFVCLMVFFSIVICSYSFFGLSSVMSQKVLQHWRHPWSFLISKWRK
jgi:hypothetical protein